MGDTISSDTISRQAAIGALAEHEKSRGHNYTLFVDIVSECAEIIRNLPPAQPEIIRCKDCIYGVLDPDGNLRCYRTGSEYDYTTMRYALGDDGFCSAAQRRRRTHE